MPARRPRKAGKIQACWQVSQIVGGDGNGDAEEGSPDFKPRQGSHAVDHVVSGGDHVVWGAPLPTGLRKQENKM